MNAINGTGKRIYITTFGSLGDLHPYLALAKELKRRGHCPLLHTSEVYRAKADAEGVEFAPLSPNMEPFLNTPEFMAKTMDAKTGMEYLFREVILPALRPAYAETEALAHDADVVVTHQLCFAAQLYAEKAKKPWVSTVLAPAAMLSAYDFPVPPLSQAVAAVRAFPPVAPRIAIKLFDRMSDSWLDPIREFRRELGLTSGENAFLKGHHSPQRVLALFSEVFGKPQPDWPPNTLVTGFPFYDRNDEAPMPQELRDFLNSGGEPLVFTLGSAAVMHAKGFFEQSIAVAKRVKRRAVFLIGRDPRNRFQEPLPKNMIAAEYAPYSEIFPKACAIVHQGGVGTTAQALRAGRPMLILPFGFDQFDNAARIQRLGVGRTLSLKRYTPLHGAAEILRMVGESLYPDRAREIGAIVQAENGTAKACDALEEFLKTGKP
jgi:MGT family glycosyltransferase